MLDLLQKLGLPENERVLVTVVSISQETRPGAENCYNAALRLSPRHTLTPALSGDPYHLNWLRRLKTHRSQLQALGRPSLKRASRDVA